MTRYGKRSARGVKSERVASIRMAQLLVCLILFSTVYVAKGVFPYKIQRLGEEITDLVSTTVDLREAFSELGSAVSDRETLLNQIGVFCVEVFGGQEEAAIATTATTYPTIEVESEPEVVLSEPEPAPVHSEPAPVPSVERIEEEIPPVEDVADTEEGAIMAVGLVYIPAQDNLRPLPAGYTYDMLSLGGMERTTPVFGVISSGFGYRNHPISGVDAVHNGVDIAGDIGDPIQAFGAGTVEYIGESDIYGNYFRIDHGNGVKSFYAHCNQLFVHKGDVVTAGEVVAEVGATGNVTGSHLHFELLCNGTYIDPQLYIDSV